MELRRRHGAVGLAPHRWSGPPKRRPIPAAERHSRARFLPWRKLARGSSPVRECLPPWHIVTDTQPPRRRRTQTPWPVSSPLPRRWQSALPAASRNRSPGRPHRRRRIALEHRAMRAERAAPASPRQRATEPGNWIRRDHRRDIRARTGRRGRRRTHPAPADYETAQRLISGKGRPWTSRTRRKSNSGQSLTRDKSNSDELERSGSIQGRAPCWGCQLGHALRPRNDCLDQLRPVVTLDSRSRDAGCGPLRSRVGDLRAEPRAIRRQRHGRDEHSRCKRKYRHQTGRAHLYPRTLFPGRRLYGVGPGRPLGGCLVCGLHLGIRSFAQVADRHGTALAPIAGSGGDRGAALATTQLWMQFSPIPPQAAGKSLPPGKRKTARHPGVTPPVVSVGRDNRNGRSGGKEMGKADLAGGLALVWVVGLTWISGLMTGWQTSRARSSAVSSRLKHRRR